jgi:type IV pilus assembly protein PilX
MPVAKKNQSGLSLVIALIMLVVVSLGAVAMVRSMDTTTLIAGNLAFRQSATYSGDVGLANAMAWLNAQNTATLICGSVGALANCPAGYKSNGGNSADRPASGQTWDNFWTTSLAGSAVTLAEDASGNTVAWFIQRQCAGTAAMTAAGANCIVTPSVTTSGGFAKRSGATIYTSSSQVYYRITVRVSGKKNTVSYVQAIVAL